MAAGEVRGPAPRDAASRSVLPKAPWKPLTRPLLQSSRNKCRDLGDLVTQIPSVPPKIRLFCSFLSWCSPSNVLLLKTPRSVPSLLFPTSRPFLTVRNPSSLISHQTSENPVFSSCSSKKENCRVAAGRQGAVVVCFLKACSYTCKSLIKHTHKTIMNRSSN